MMVYSGDAIVCGNVRGSLLLYMNLTRVYVDFNVCPALNPKPAIARADRSSWRQPDIAFEGFLSFFAMALKAEQLALALGFGVGVEGLGLSI